MDSGWKKFGEDVGGLRSRGYESRGAVEGGGAKAGATSLYREEDLRSGGVRERVAEDAREGTELEGVKVEESGFEVERVAGTETVGKFRK